MAKWHAKQQMVELTAGKPEPMGWFVENDRGEFLRSERTDPEGEQAKWRTPDEAEARAKADELNGGQK